MFCLEKISIGFSRKQYFAQITKSPRGSYSSKKRSIFTIKAGLDGALLHTDMKVTSQQHRIQNHCPNLLRGYVSYLQAGANDNADTVEDNAP